MAFPGLAHCLSQHLHRFRHVWTTHRQAALISRSYSCMAAIQSTSWSSTIDRGVAAGLHFSSDIRRSSATCLGSASSSVSARSGLSRTVRFMITISDAHPSPLLMCPVPRPAVQAQQTLRSWRRPSETDSLSRQSTLPHCCRVRAVHGLEDHAQYPRVLKGSCKRVPLQCVQAHLQVSQEITSVCMCARPARPQLEGCKHIRRIELFVFALLSHNPSAHVAPLLGDPLHVVQPALFLDDLVLGHFRHLPRFTRRVCVEEVPSFIHLLPVCIHVHAPGVCLSTFVSLPVSSPVCEHSSRFILMGLLRCPRSLMI